MKFIWQNNLPSFNEGNIVQKGFNAVKDLFGNFLRGKTGSGLTAAQTEQNQWQEQMSNTSYQRGTEDMQEAGLNPAMMYGSGANGASVPSGASVSEPSGSFGEVVNAMLLPLQLEQMKVNIQKTREDTESVKVSRQKILQEVENLKQTYHEIQSRTDLNDTQRENLFTIGMYLDRMQDAALRKAEIEIALDKATKRRIEALLPGELEIQKMSIEDFRHQWAEIEAKIDQIANQTKLLKEDLTNYAVNRLSGPVGDIFRAWLEGKRDKDNDGLADDRGERE